MKRAGLMVAAMALMTVGVGSAIARPSLPTKITHDATVALNGNGSFILTGHVSSSKNDCVYPRAVKVIGRRENGTRKLLDFDTTSVHGAWAASVNLANIDRIKAKVLKTSTENGNVCQGAALVFSPPPT